MATDLILVSHALTQWNVEGRIQGHTDVPLNALGKKMALELANRLERENIHAVYTSDLKRAWQTAEPAAAQKSLTVTRDARLREGRSKNQERSDIYPTLPFYRDVETEETLYKRMAAAVSKIARSHDDQTVLVVSHGGAQRVLITRMFKKTPSLKYQGIRMALNKLRYHDGHWQCLGLDEIDFLPPQLQVIANG